MAVRRLTPTTARLTFRSAGWHHRLGFELPGLSHTAADNYFELYPEEPHEVEITFGQPVSAAQITACLQWISVGEAGS